MSNRSVFHLTDNQQKDAAYFEDTHGKICPKISEEDRAFMETEEQATVESSYMYTFRPGGIADDCHIECCLCHARTQLRMSEEELDMI